MSITLPPLPERPWRMFCTKCGMTSPLAAKDVQHSPPNLPAGIHFGVCPCGYQALAEQAPWTADQLRARDTEVARVVLKAAADLVDGNAAYCSGQTASILGANADAIRKMEVRHHE